VKFLNFSAFVYPHLLYVVEIYGILEKLTNNILRILQNKPIRSNTIDLYTYYDDN